MFTNDATVLNAGRVSFMYMNVFINDVGDDSCDSPLWFQSTTTELRSARDSGWLPLSDTPADSSQTGDHEEHLWTGSHA